MTKTQDLDFIDAPAQAEEKPAFSSTVSMLATYRQRHLTPPAVRINEAEDALRDAEAKARRLEFALREIAELAIDGDIEAGPEMAHEALTAEKADSNTAGWLIEFVNRSVKHLSGSK